MALTHDGPHPPCPASTMALTRDGPHPRSARIHEGPHIPRPSYTDLDHFRRVILTQARPTDDACLIVSRPSRALICRATELCLSSHNLPLAVVVIIAAGAEGWQSPCIIDKRKRWSRDKRTSLRVSLARWRAFIASGEVGEVWWKGYVGSRESRRWSEEERPLSTTGS